MQSPSYAKSVMDIDCATPAFTCVRHKVYLQMHILAQQEDPPSNPPEISEQAEAVCQDRRLHRGCVGR
eukprot:3174795-Rhodomonas_salina.1